MDTSETDDETLKQQFREFFARGIPFNQVLGIEIDSLDKGLAVIRMPFKPELIGDPFRPALHGGAVAALLDACGGAALWSTLTLAARISTVDIRVDYLRPGRAEPLIAEGRVRRAGNRMGVVAIKAYHPGSEDEPIAEAMAVYNIRRETHAR